MPEEHEVIATEETPSWFPPESGEGVFDATTDEDVPALEVEEPVAEEGPVA